MTDSTTEKAGNNDVTAAGKPGQTRQRMLEELRKCMPLLWQLGGGIIKFCNAGHSRSLSQKPTRRRIEGREVEIA
jgi:hypothetical protein